MTATPLAVAAIGRSDARRASTRSLVAPNGTPATVRCGTTVSNRPPNGGWSGEPLPQRLGDGGERLGRIGREVEHLAVELGEVRELEVERGEAPHDVRDLVDDRVRDELRRDDGYRTVTCGGTPIHAYGSKASRTGPTASVASWTTTTRPVWSGSSHE